MKITIDLQKKILVFNKKKFNLFSKNSFDIISNFWKLLGWKLKYSYTFTWLGRPIIQTPEDLIRVQELIFKIKPYQIVETGIAHGGSIIYYASLLKILGLGKIIGVDIDIRKKNLKAINDHFLKKSIHLIEGSSINKETINIVKKKLTKNKKTLVILDSNHSKDHVLEELRLYSEFVTKNSYIIVCDGIMQELDQFPGIPKSWNEDNPIAAIKIFLKENKNFILEEPKWLFNESKLNKSISYWPKGFLKRIR